MKKPPSHKFKQKAKEEEKKVITEAKKEHSEAKNGLTSSKFPSISRFITANIPHGRMLKNYRFWILLVSFLLTIAIVFAFLNLYHEVTVKRETETKVNEISSEIEYWQNVVAEHKDYRDGYFKLALLEYQLGNTQKSWDYVEKALVLDPNFEKGRELEKILKR